MCSHTCAASRLVLKKDKGDSSTPWISKLSGGFTGQPAIRHPRLVHTAACVWLCIICSWRRRDCLRCEHAGLPRPARMVHLRGECLIHCPRFAAGRCPELAVTLQAYGLASFPVHLMRSSGSGLQVMTAVLLPLRLVC